MPLTVLSIAFPFAPVSRDAVGGAEQILSTMDAALVAAGETSLVVACEGSRVAGKLFPTRLPQSELLQEADKSWCRKQCQAAIDRALNSRRVDLIHMHGLDFNEYALPAGIPTLVTLHLPIEWYPPEVWIRYRDKAQFCCVSESQRRCYPAGLDNCSVVENGVALPPYPAVKPRQNFALVMGRICPEKNAAAALQAGTLARTPVLLAGQVFPYREHRQYFQETIEPLLQGQAGGVQHEFLGPQSSLQMQDLLARAKCLLHPTLAPETSSLVAMEALAAGTPVIAYRSGALPEVVEHGVTGFLVDSVQEMAEAMGQVHTLSSEACRRAAEQRFSKERMVQRYFEQYESLLYAPRLRSRHA